MSSDEGITAAATSPSGGTAHLIDLLKSRAPRVAVGLAATQALMPLAKKAHHRAQAHTTYVISVRADDDIYDDLHAWVLDRLPPASRRALLGYSGSASSRNLIEVGSAESTPPPKMRFRYDGSVTQTIRVDGHRVRVGVTEGSDTFDSGMRFSLTLPTMVFTVRSASARDALAATMDELLAERHKRDHQPAFRLGRWSDWYTIHDLAPRAMESVILPDDQLGRIVDDMAQFLSSEDDYTRRCMMWHRGYLFEGPPGTGKSSAARALAHHFGLDLYYLPLADVERDSSLLAMIGNIKPRSVLLLEDIDVFHAATFRDDEAKVTMSGLLNSLDGIATPHGLITIMTTNDPSTLDPALVRPGRVDLREHFGLAGPDQIKRLYRWFYGQPWPRNVGLSAKPMAPADVVGAMHRFPNDADEGVLSIQALA